MRFTQYRLIFLVSLFFVLFYNFSFFQNVLKVYPWEEKSIYVASTALFLLSFFVLFFTILSSRWTTKPILILTLIVSSFTAYFMDTYHVVIDEGMIRNTLQTDVSEAGDLFSFEMILYGVFLGFIPAWLVYKVKIEYKTFTKEIISKLKVIALSVIVILVILFSFSKFYTSFFREHKPLRYYTNPTYWIYSIGKYVERTYFDKPLKMKQIGLDAKIEDSQKRIVFMIVGEAARADRFSLNGYERETNPLLKQEDIINFSNMYSCGTSTAHSVPCMFSIYDRDEYNYKKGISTENVVDVLKHTKDVAILWRDNNSDSKGVALRVPYENFKRSNKYIKCDGECRDEQMLVGLDEFIKNAKEKNIFIILHQMGNHGPAYYRRYPKEFEKFKPVCKTNQLEQCKKEEVSNAYDNAILYTDYFLAKVIDFLKKYDDDYETAMIYMSDHGESLGEGGIYLHGLPYFMAPANQKHIASIMWFGKNFKVDKEKLKSYSNEKFSQDNLFSTILGLFDVKTNVYDKDKDILKKAKK